MYYLLLTNQQARDTFIAWMSDAGINTVFHYVPLHQSPVGKHFVRSCEDLSITHYAGGCLVRLPLWLGLEEHQETVIDSVLEYFSATHLKPDNCETNYR